MNGVFITGSNTEVGKTTVLVEIIKTPKKKRRKIVVRKTSRNRLRNGKSALMFPKDAIKLNEPPPPRFHLCLEQARYH
jgi:dethiobiotin synthetase